MTDVAAETRAALAGIAAGRAETLQAELELHDAPLEAIELDALSISLVRIAVLVALDAPPAAYAWQVAEAIESGATPEQILGVLRAIAPQVGGPRVIAAAPEVMLALGLALPEGPE